LGLLEKTGYQALEFHLDPGDTLVLASDGTMDALNTEGSFYDIGRFTESIQRHSGKDVAGMLRSAYSDIMEFIGSAELSDDITLFALRRTQ